MKSATSILNPYAAAYVPLSKRGLSDKNEVLTRTEKDSESSNQTPQNKQRGRVFPHPNVQGNGLPAQNSNEIAANNQNMDEEFEMDMEYLQMQFPGISDQSITHVYLANKGDLEATIDMLSHLEGYADESPEYLPETLDIGDVSESGSPAEHASQKLRSLTGEASTSSNTTDSAVVA